MAFVKWTIYIRKRQYYFLHSSIKARNCQLSLQLVLLYCCSAGCFALPPNYSYVAGYLYGGIDKLLYKQSYELASAL